MVLFRIDAEKGEGLELAKAYTITGYPTFVLMNISGETINRWSGYGEVGSFVSTLSGALADLTTIDEKRERYAAHPTTGDAEILARYHSSRDEYVDAVRLLREAQDLGGGDGSAIAFDIFYNTAFGFLEGRRGDDGPPFDMDAVRAAADDVLAGYGEDLAMTMKVAGLMQFVAARAGEPAAMVPYIKTAVERGEGSQDSVVIKGREQLLVDYTLHVVGDKAKAVELKRSGMNEGWTDRAGDLNTFAWWCFENGVNLEEAEALARKGADLAEAGREKAMILDTAAELCHARGNTDEALALIRQAVAEAPEDDYFREQLDRFEGLVAARE